MKALNYKDKHFILADDEVEEEWEGLETYINIEKIVGDDTLLRRHIRDCRYYGIAPYIGKDKVLLDRIEKIEIEMDVHTIDRRCIMVSGKECLTRK